MIGDFVEPSPLSLLHLWSAATVIFGLFFTSLTKVLLARQISLAARQSLGRVIFVPNFFHLRNMEATVLFGTLNAAEVLLQPWPENCVSELHEPCSLS